MLCGPLQMSRFLRDDGPVPGDEIVADPVSAVKITEFYFEAILATAS